MSRIVRVEVGRYDYEFAGEFKFFPPGDDGKIRRPSVLVRLTDEDGFQGWGQAVPVPTWSYETVESVETTLRHYLAKVVLGTDPTDLEGIYQHMERAIRPGLTVGQPICKAAIDLACYDLAGQRAQKPVAELLGGAKSGSLQLGWTVASPELSHVEAQLAEGIDRGYRNFNFKVGPPQSPDYDLQLARTIRLHAPEGFLWADANTGYELDTALEVLPKLADVGVEVIESPLPPMNIRGYQALKQQRALPIFMDEGLISPMEAGAFIAMGMLDGITLKVGRSGGLWHSHQLVDLAYQNGLRLLGSGLTDPDLSLIASVHLFAFAGIKEPCALNGPQYLAETLAVNKFLPEADEIDVPKEPGLGLIMGSDAESVLKIVAES